MKIKVFTAHSQCVADDYLSDLQRDVNNGHAILNQQGGILHLQAALVFRKGHAQMLTSGSRVLQVRRVQL